MLASRLADDQRSLVPVIHFNLPAARREEAKGPPPDPRRRKSQIR